MIFYYRSNAKSWAFFGFRVEGFDSWVHWFVVLHIVANIVYSELLILCFGSWFNGLLICVFFFFLLILSFSFQIFKPLLEILYCLRTIIKCLELVMDSDILANEAKQIYNI